MVQKIDITKFTWRDELAQIIKPGGLGAELGVAKGTFSEKLLRKSQLSILYSIDRYAGDRGHDEAQMKAAVELLKPYADRSRLLRMSFDEALGQFEDNFFDFIYIDGYAHTGLEDGKILSDWWPKLKSGGIFAGDDYSEKWPKVIEQVNKFSAAENLKVNVIKDWNGHHSWVIFKP